MFHTLPPPEKMPDDYSGGLQNFEETCLNVKKVVQRSKKLLQSPNLPAFCWSQKAAAVWSCWVGANLAPQLWRVALMGVFVILIWGALKRTLRGRKGI